MVPSALPPYRRVSRVSISGLGVRVVQVALATTILTGPTRVGGILLPHYGLAVLCLPDIINRLASVSLSPAHRLWIAGGIALHPIGALYEYYDTVWWFDHLAHAASASLLAAGLYACLLTVRRSQSEEVTSPPAIKVGGHLAVFALVMTGGVSWEVFEAYTPALVVYGPTDTLLDLVFDVVGWALVAPVAHRVVGNVPVGLVRSLGRTGAEQVERSRSVRRSGPES